MVTVKELARLASDTAGVPLTQGQVIALSVLDHLFVILKRGEDIKLGKTSLRALVEETK